METLRFESILLQVPGKGKVRIQGSVTPSERVVIKGPSGCGKSTLLRLVAGLQHPEKGQIFLGEEDITRKEPHQINAALVFQSGALFPHLSVADNVAFALKFFPKFKDWSDELKKTRALEFLKQGSLEALADRLPQSLSGGERQRVALLRSLVYEPRVLMLDEPLSSVDPDQRLELQNWILQILKDRPVPTLIVTHDREESEKLGTRVVTWHPDFIKF